MSEADKGGLRHTSSQCHKGLIVTINSSTTTSSFLSISSQTGNSIAIGRGAVANGSNSIAIGNVALINGFTNSVAIGAGASCNANNQIVLGTASQSVILNTITPLYTTLPTFTSSQIGYTYNGTMNSSSSLNGDNAIGTINISVAGVYLFIFGIQIDSLPATVYVYFSGTNANGSQQICVRLLGNSSLITGGSQVINATVSTYYIRVNVSSASNFGPPNNFFKATRIA